MTEYLTATQAAARLGTSLTNVARWCRDGTLPAERLGIGRIWRIKAEDVEKFVTPARGPKPAEDRKRLLEMAKELVADHPEFTNPDTDMHGWEVSLARAGQCSLSRARQALAKAIRLARAPKPECPYCKGTGVADSGGFDAQDRPINIPCPYCDGAK